MRVFSSRGKDGKAYLSNFSRYSYTDRHCVELEQYEASITRLSHTIEKGLSFMDYRPGFGKNNIETLISTLDEFSKHFDVSAPCYETALSTLHEYVKKNKSFGYEDPAVEQQINKLPGQPNNEGGVIAYQPSGAEEVQKYPFSEFVKDRHSVRTFSAEPVSMERVRLALDLAKYTPSACNRQGWRTRVITNKELLQKILENQNGNRGFGNEIDKLIIVTSDIRYFQKSREVFQPFIDGGMYAQSLLYALHYCHIGTIPLSAALTDSQEAAVRELAKLDRSEVMILLIGIGNYKDECLIPKSSRKEPWVQELN